LIASLLKKIPVQLKGEWIARKENCRFCGDNSALLIANVDYWDIKSTALVKCTTCNLAQLDPMLTNEQTSRGCRSYYMEESMRTSLSEKKRNLIRNFRRGVLFGHSLRKRKFKIEEVLEFGPGSGYFLEGIKFIYPEIRITVMDINPEVVNFNKSHHHYVTHLAPPENYIPELANRFDLIIARDFLEHVTDISAVIGNVKQYAKANGLFHFITPNGHEDLWKHYLAFRYLNKSSELLINHVNYFDGKGLLNYLSEQQFTPVDYYTYKFKTTLKGRGWMVKPKLMAPASQKKSAGSYFEKALKQAANNEFNKEDVLNEWYISKRYRNLTLLMSRFHHNSLVKVDPKYNVGHEIYGLFRAPGRE